MAFTTREGMRAFSYANDFRAFIMEIESENPVEVDEEMFWYFLEVLPPVYMSKDVTLPNGDKIHASFGFAEGYEKVKAFWKKGGRYFACQTREMNPNA